MATLATVSRARFPRTPLALSSNEIEQNTCRSFGFSGSLHRMEPTLGLGESEEEQNGLPRLRATPYRTGAFLSQLSTDALQELKAIERHLALDEGSLLFCEGGEPESVYVVLEGMVKLSINSRDGHRLILRIAGPGDIIGMASGILGLPYDSTAETIHTCKIAALKKADFLRLLRNHPEAAQGATVEIGKRYIEACETLRLLNRNLRAAGRLACLLLNWSSGTVETDCETRIRVFLTHEEIGEFIGVSRETVTRIFTDFKEKKLIVLNGSTLTIPNKFALLSVAEASRSYGAS